MTVYQIQLHPAEFHIGIEPQTACPRPLPAHAAPYQCKHSRELPSRVFLAVDRMSGAGSCIQFTFRLEIRVRPVLIDQSGKFANSEDAAAEAEWIIPDPGGSCKEMPGSASDRTGAQSLTPSGRFRIPGEQSVPRRSARLQKPKTARHRTDPFCQR